MALRQTSSLSESADGCAESAFRTLLRTIGLIERVMQPYFARHGISGSQWGVLRTLHRAEANETRGMRHTELSERLLIRPPSVTGVIDRLERAGLVARASVPDDLRAKSVSLTVKGRQLVNRVLAAHDGQIGAVMGALSGAQQRELDALLGRLGAHLETLADTEEKTAAS